MKLKRNCPQSSPRFFFLLLHSIFILNRMEWSLTNLRIERWIEEIETLTKGIGVNYSVLVDMNDGRSNKILHLAKLLK